MKFLDKDPETAKSATFQAGRIWMQMQMQKSLDPDPDSSNLDPKHYNVKECVWSDLHPLLMTRTSLVMKSLKMSMRISGETAPSPGLSNS